MYDISIIKQNGGYYMDSREVAKLIEKKHNDLLRDIRGYISIMVNGGERKIAHSDFFIESSYQSAQNKKMPCYLITKLGAEMVANKLTGEKGILFTAIYVKKFNELEAADRAEQKIINGMPVPRLGEYNACARIIVRALSYVGAPPDKIVRFLKGIYEPLGISVMYDNEDIDEMPLTYTAKEIAEMLGVYSVNGNPHPQAVSCILNENLFISDCHKSVTPMDYNGYTGVSVRYDSFAVLLVKDWIAENGYPEDIFGLDKTYKVRYMQ